MIILFYGPDSYRRQQKLNAIIDEYQRKHSAFSCGYFNLDPSANSGQEEFLKLKEFASQRLLFDNKRLAIVKGEPEEEISGEFKKFLAACADSSELTVLISWDKKPLKKFEPIFKKAFLVEEFRNYSDEKAVFFAKKEAARRGIVLSDQAADFLADFFAGDSWGLISELDKLSFLNKKELDIEDLKAAGDYNQSPNIFGYINAVSGNWPLKRKILNLEKLFLAREEPAKIFNILAGLDRLTNELIRRLADYDIMVKSGKLDYEEALLDLALG
ncbi:hypothetical protein HZB06_00160 [Candidatus Wolfebacteria bacterium]|nr:hypothetical protein [Candidatus Wolfebacteria bacterium]